MNMNMNIITKFRHFIQNAVCPFVHPKPLYITCFTMKIHFYLLSKPVLTIIKHRHFLYVSQWHVSWGKKSWKCSLMCFGTKSLNYKLYFLSLHINTVAYLSAFKINQEKRYCQYTNRGRHINTFHSSSLRNAAPPLSKKTKKYLCPSKD